jgi:hypothetical protein
VNSLCSLQQDPAALYGRRRVVNSVFTKVNVYQADPSFYQAVGAIINIKIIIPRLE